MAENNNKKNEYSVGYNGSFFDDFPDFDSMEKTPAKPITPKQEAGTVTPEQSQEYTQPEKSELKSDEPVGEKKAKKNITFSLICAVMAVAIIACSTLSVFSINKFLHSSSDTAVSADEDGYNIYSEMVPKYGTVKYPSGIVQNMARAYAANNDVVGWLYIAGTNINTPVVQSKDNNYYLRNNFYKTYTKYGTTYADYRCNRNELSKNVVIYGHNMPSGTHFYDVNRYEDIEWYKKNPVITYTTLTGTYTYLIYTAFYSTAKGSADGGYVFNYIFPNMSNSNFEGYMEQVNQRALYKTSVDLKVTDKIITLSTCNHTYDKQCGTEVDSRLVVIGRLLRDGESSEVNVSAAKENSNYRRPQIWYNKKGKTNPYANSRSWQPSSK